MSIKKDHRSQLKEVTFRCGRHGAFKAEPARVDADPEDAVHPWRYFAFCPDCDAECGQAHWERSLLKAWQKATGPTSDEGKAASAENLVGHPTKEESLRTRFNAMKHGASAKVATYFPAKPDGYALCATCDVDRYYCSQQPCCVKQTQNFMLHHAAFEQRKPGMLTGMYADMQAAIFSILQQIIMTIIADGVKLTRPEFHFDESGKLSLATYTDELGEKRTIMEVSAHPLLKAMSELLTKNNMSLADMGMTNKVIEAEDMLPGQVSRNVVPLISDDEYRRQQIAALKNLSDKVMRSNKLTSADPVLVEFGRENGAVGEVIDVDATDVSEQ
ncbi:hypothetical protein [Herminiimonas sp. CN]|uniref:hypothetical protein n=1 Tax=Herminiimonas sp. CN TaxID=1349818 RepID=UPI0004741925|nr:hypothetical protein [Herminiimonas sp. CN]